MEALSSGGSANQCRVLYLEENWVTPRSHRTYRRQTINAAHFPVAAFRESENGLFGNGCRYRRRGVFAMGERQAREIARSTSRCVEQEENKRDTKSPLQSAVVDHVVKSH